MLLVFTGAREARGVTETVADAAPVPAALVAVTEQVYVELFVSPDTEIGLDVPVAVIGDATPV
jgi:hypothetical protein